MIQAGDIVVITGIMAAGKSTIAQALAERLPRSVHLRGDIFRRFIVGGQAAVTPGNWTEAEQQLHLRYKLASSAAITYADAGFAVVYQDVILGTEVSRVLELLRPSPGRIFLVVLAPEPEVAAERDHVRPKTGYTDWTPHELDEGLRAGTPRIGYWLDNSTLSVDQTVDAILANLTSAEGTAIEPQPTVE
jgi:predicted kinase